MPGSVLFLVRFLSIEGEPMGVMQLSSIARQVGWSTALCTARDDVGAILRRMRPSVLAVSMMSTDYAELMPILRSVRRAFPELPIIVGGPHPTFVPDFVHDEAVTAICVGEGDRAFPEVLKRIEAGDSFDGIPNIRTRTALDSGLAPLLDDLDSLPFMDREIAYSRSLALKRFRLRSFYTSRGCPYRCSYCFNHAYNTLYRGHGKIVRKRSVDRVINDVLETVSRYRTEYIRFADDVFVLQADEWLQEFSRRFPKEVGIPFYCLIRPNTVTPDMVRLLKESGCRSVCMSIESASPGIRRKVLNRDISNEKIIASFDTFNEAGIHIYTNAIAGFPTATFQDEMDSLDLSIRCRAEYAGFSIATPFPGTQLFEFCKEQGVLPEKIDSDDFVSTVSGSLLTCFTEDERRIQKNLVLLGGFVIRYPMFKNIVIRHFLKLRPNFAFKMIHFMVKNIVFWRYICPVKMSPVDVVVFAWGQMTTFLSSLSRFSSYHRKNEAMTKADSR